MSGEDMSEQEWESVFLQNMGTARAVARTMWGRSPFIRRVLGCREDAEQSALLWIWKYRLRYLGTGISVEGYFAQSARRGVWRAVSLASKRKKAGHPEVFELPKEDYDRKLVEDFHCVMEEVLDRIEVAQFLGVLTRREREVICLFYGLDGCGRGRSHLEIAKMLGVTENWIAQIIHMAKRRLRTNFKVCEK